LISAWMSPIKENYLWTTPPKILDELDLKALSDLAESYCDRGEWNRAYEMRKRVWERREALLGIDHHDTLAAKANMALSLTKLGRIREAIKLRIELFKSSQVIFGFSHVTTLRYYLELAKTTAKAPSVQAKLDAEKIREKCFQIWKNRIDLGETEYQLEFLESKKAYARSLEERISTADEDAEELFERAMEFRKDILKTIQNAQQPHDLQVAKAMNDKAECYTFYGRYEDAKDTRLQILDQFEDQFKNVLHLPSDISLQRIYMKILEGLARDYTNLAEDYRQSKSPPG